MRLRIKFIFLLALVFSLCTARNSHSDVSILDYFPVTKGMYWKFNNHRVVISDDALQTESSYISIFKNTGTEVLKGKKTYTSLHESISSTQRIEVKCYYLITDESVAAYADETKILRSGTEPRMVRQIIYPKPLIQLRLPIKVGNSWVNRFNGFEEYYRIVAINETVRTSAGLFSNCLQVEWLKTQKVRGETVKISANTWYALGIGKVKRVTIRETKKERRETRTELAEYGK